MNTSIIERIGDYVLEQTIGSGSFGKVKRACHEPTGCSVAIKIISKENIKEKPDIYLKIKREINNLKKFRHPHIIKLYEVIETETDIYLVMEFVNGGELFDYIIQSGRLSENEGRYYFQQMISAVGYCHKLKVAHRDLKPENLFLSGNKNSLKIGDFGLSNIMQDGEFLKTSCGSPNYAAPEVIDGKYYSGEEIDVWSSGIILYAIVTARLPFDDDYIPHLFNKIKRGKFKMPSYLSGPCQDLIRQMLNTDPLKRITIPEIRHHPWFVENLPQYLANYLDNYVEEVKEELDTEILEELEDIFRLDRNELINEINFNERNRITVSYLLLYDRKYENIHFSKSFQHRHAKDKDLARSVAELSISPPLNLREEIPFLYSGSQINVLDALKAQENKNMKKKISDLTQCPSEHNEYRKKIWYLGIISKKTPEEIMNEVFRVLKKLNFEWKIVQPFQIHARPQKQYSQLEDYDFEENILLDHSSIESGNQVKFSLQLFKINPKKSGEIMHLLDIKNLKGHPITFFDQCALLIEELKV